MSRGNNVRGPTSALTEFLRESGINPTTIARRVRTREVAQPAAGPSNAAQDDQAEERQGGQDAEEYASDHLDDSDEEPAPKKRKMTKAAEAKLKAKEKAKAKGKGKKKGDDEDSEDEDEDAYTALSKMWKDTTKPPVGSFENCARCKKQFTVTKYTMAANPPPGFLCHLCAKASGGDPFKKPPAPRKRKAPADKRSIVHFEEKRFPSLVSLCVGIISSHIDDVEALGDVGSVNLDEIAKAISKNRSLTPQNAPLFYDVQNTTLTLYDATSLIPPALCTLAALNPNLTSLRIDYCGRIDNSVLSSWSSALPHLKRLELLGPFLVYPSAWKTFFESHPALEAFLITQSPRFDVECVQSLVENCTGLEELRLKEIGKMDDAFLKHIHKLGGHLTYLDLSCPGKPELVTEKAMIDLMSYVCGSLSHLDVSNYLLSDAFLYQGLKPHARHLSSLKLANIPDLTDAGVAEFFNTWASAPRRSPEFAANPGLNAVDFSRNHVLAGEALSALLKHSGNTLTDLSINGWKAVPQETLQEIAKRAPNLRSLDMGWCREADDWIVRDLLEKCPRLEELKVWGCQRLTESCPRKRFVSIHGVEAHSVAV